MNLKYMILYNRPYNPNNNIDKQNGGVSSLYNSFRAGCRGFESRLPLQTTNLIARYDLLPIDTMGKIPYHYYCHRPIGR